MTYETAANVARHVNVSRTTLLSACERKLIRTKKLKLGTKLIHIEDAVRFADEKHVPLDNKGPKTDENS